MTKLKISGQPQKAHQTFPLKSSYLCQHIEIRALKRVAREPNRYNMRHILQLCSIFLLVMCAIPAGYAQVSLLKEDFNSCILPQGWQVSTSGNPVVEWYVGIAQNDQIQGQSIDSTCFLFIDDYSNPSSTSYVLNFVSPSFNVTPYETVLFTMDVYFRSREDDYMDILVTDGAKEVLLARYDKGWNNDGGPADHFTLKHDLSLSSKSTTARIIIRYVSPTSSDGFFAGIDNISIVGSGSGANVIREAFNDCVKPAGWTTEVLNGTNGWQFGRVPPGTSAYNNGSTMDGSCFVYFNDIEFEDTQSSATRLYSPWFDGTKFFEYELNFDAMLRYNGGEVLNVYLQQDPSEDIVLYRSEGHVGGPSLPDFLHFTFDLTPYRSPQMRLVFEFDDNDVWGYWTGLDNVKVTGRGPAFDFCSQALTLLTGAPCQVANNATALFDGPDAGCSGKTTGSLWYRWQADFSGAAKLSTHASFNDVVSIFSGSCTGLVPEICDNYDEHGFAGENTYFTAQNGKQYYIRISGLAEGFGLSRGDICVEVNQAGGTPTRPNNDHCANAVSLAVNTACTNGSNVNALTSATLPSLNQLARADVWYRFTATALPAGEVYEIRSNANFSDIITVYRGGCNSLQEVAGNHAGGTLELPALTNGTTYYVQIAGNFATVEGSLCAQVVTKKMKTPVNDNCLAAVPLTLDGPCVAGSNADAGFSGLQPSCAVAANRDIWFKFEAPAFGSVHINTGATFEHTLALWEGDCGQLKQVYCAANPLRCTGYVTAGSLNSGQTYYLQIASRVGAAGSGAGTVCVRVLDGKTQAAFKPLSLAVQTACVGMDTAKLTVKVSGGTAPYTFPANTPGQILLSGMPYTVAVADANGCENYVSGVVGPCASNVCTQEVGLDALQPLCAGETGALFADLSGGTPPFEFYWSNDIFTPDNAGLPAGTYTITVIDANGCESVLTETIIPPDSVRITPDNIAFPTQGQSNGAIQITVSGGTGPYEYTWLVNGNPFATGTEDLGNLRKGLYSLLVRDVNGCEGAFWVNLPETVGTKLRIAPAHARLTPNPATDRAQLWVSFSQTRTVRLSITDAAGRTLRDWTAEYVREQQLPIELGDLPGGVYFLWARADEESFVTKLVVGK